MIGKAPVLAGILTALTCFVAGAIVGEGWSQAVPPPTFAPVGLVVTVEVAYQSTAIPRPTFTLLPTLTPAPTRPPPVPTLTPGAFFPDPSAADFPTPTPTPIVDPLAPLEPMRTPTFGPSEPTSTPRPGGTRNVP